MRFRLFLAWMALAIGCNRLELKSELVSRQGEIEEKTPAADTQTVSTFEVKAKAGVEHVAEAPLSAFKAVEPNERDQVDVAIESAVRELLARDSHNWLKVPF